MKLILEVENEDEALLELATIMIKLRHNTKTWESEYGVFTKRAKKYWEEKADEWIKKHVKTEQ